ncbi:MAG: hypothetical protein ACP5G2_04740 [Candidatus Bipolaricaulaceae bacterium]
MRERVLLLTLCVWLGWPAGAAVTGADAERAGALARAALADELGVAAAEVEVLEVIGRRFPDVSLGLREPGCSYAQVVTRGHVVRLAAGGREFEYRIADGRVMRVPEVPPGPAPEEMWVVQVFAYRPDVDVALHGHVACDRDAVLPLARWAPLTGPPLLAALDFLIHDGLAPWEEQAGYMSEFPLPGVALATASLAQGVLTLTIVDPENWTTGGACRIGIMRAQIEKTARQFPEVEEVHILPPTVLQP